MAERSNHMPSGLYAGGGYGRLPRQISLESSGITDFSRYPQPVQAAVRCVVRASLWNNGEGDKSVWELRAAWQLCSVLLLLAAEDRPFPHALGASLGELIVKGAPAGQTVRKLPVAVLNGIRESSIAFGSDTGATVDSHKRLQETTLIK